MRPRPLLAVVLALLAAVMPAAAQAPATGATPATGGQVLAPSSAGPGQALPPSTAPRDVAPPATGRPPAARAPVAVADTPQGFAPIPPLTSPVIDTTGTLDTQTRQRLEQQALDLQRRKGAQLQVLMIPTTRPEEIEEYSVRAYEQYRLGRAKVDDGVLVVVAKDDRRARVEVGYGLEGAIPDALAIRVITDYMTPHFRQGDYAGGLVEATQAIVRLIDQEALPAPAAQGAADGARSRGGSPMLALIAAFFVAQFVRGLFGGTPAFFRGIAGGLAAGFIAFLLANILFGAIGGLIGFFMGLAGGRRVRYARDAGFGGFGGWGGGGFGGFGGGGFGGGGGWSGGGGMSGGGGASGSW